MARAYRECPHPSRALRLSVLEVEPPVGEHFMRKFPFPETHGCDECRAKWGVGDRYFAVPMKEGQDLLDALLEAVQRLGGPLYAMAVAAVREEVRTGEPPSGGGVPTRRL